MQKAVNDDPTHPRVYRLISPPETRVTEGLRVLGGRYAYENADAAYRSIPISRNYSYIIHGQRTGAGSTDVTFFQKRDATFQYTISALTNEDLDINSHGSFQITVSSSGSYSPDHMQSTPDAAQIFIRNSLGDWQGETPDGLEVELVRGYELPDKISNDTIIESARRHFSDSIGLFPNFLGNSTLPQPVNEIESPIQSLTLGTLVTRASSFGHLNLTNNEVIIVHLNPGPATYWTIPGYTPWMTTDNARDRLESWNSKQAVANDDGTYRLALSATNPGVFNWINTT